MAAILQASYYGRHAGEWWTASDGLPVELHRCDQALDWWKGEPVGSRTVDTVYTEREGPLEIIWPRRGYKLRIDPSNSLGFTVVYTPAGQDFFCVEPVSHATDAINRPDTESRLRWLDPGAKTAVWVTYQAQPINPDS